MKRSPYPLLGAVVIEAAALAVAILQQPLAAAAADAPLFRRHVIDAASTYCACAAIDVDRDGRLDIVCGGVWRQAPDWRPHKLRDVEMIRGRYDDYSHLPMDVNGDGRLDLVSANYRSQSIYWVEQPADGVGVWKKHLIDAPGAMETGRLVDVDGDGRLDILPNGVQFAAWYELLPGAGVVDRFVRHDLPAEIAGHGVGCGDINGDGRPDIVSSRGWLEAPEDPRGGMWIRRPEFELHRDASIPIVVWDVDGDGDSDLVWGRGHGFGLYWLEQVREGDARAWRRHAIDSEWSQAHSLLLADLNNDGVDELVAGKRYMGHDGKDLGEYDPLGIYAYSFDKSSRAFSRAPIDVGGPVGFGLDPKAVDLDADGDVDLIAPGRSGLYWLENLHLSPPGDLAAPPPAAAIAAVGASAIDHRQLMNYVDESGSLQPVVSPADWAKRRAQIVAGMQQAMGPLPDPSRRVPLDVEVVEEVRAEKYVRRKIWYSPEPNDRVPAFLLVPHALTGKAPAMLCLHQTTGIGKGEPAGLGGLPNLHYAHELAERGFVCLAPDYPSFGDYPYDFQKTSLEAGGPYGSGSMKAIWNNIRAIDLLESLPEVDSDRIGCIGHSLGGHNSLFTAVFEQRIRAVVSSCGFNAFHHYFDGNLEGWTSDRYMPRIRERYGNDPSRMPFDFYEVVAALAPRAFFTNSPLGDDNFEVEGVRTVMAEAAKVYELFGAGEKLQAAYPDAGHDFPADVRRQAFEWLEKQLQ